MLTALDVSDEKAALFRARLLRAVEERLDMPSVVPSPSFSRELVDSVPLTEVVETVSVVEGVIAEYDMAACIKSGGLYGSESMKKLARWLVDGGTPEARGLLKVLRDYSAIAIWPLVEAQVSPEYLAASVKAGITDGAVIAQGYSDGIAIEFLVSVVD